MTSVPPAEAHRAETPSGRFLWPPRRAAEGPECDPGSRLQKLLALDPREPLDILAQLASSPSHGTLSSKRSRPADVASGEKPSGGQDQDQDQC